MGISLRGTVFIILAVAGFSLAPAARAAHATNFLDALQSEVTNRVANPGTNAAQQRALSSAARSLNRNTKTLAADLGALAVAMGSHAYAAGQESAQPPAARVFASDAGVVLNLIKPDKTADFEAVIAKLPVAVARYAYPNSYSAWPGPNSNTFTAHLGRAIPELRLTLPSLAIGKDYLPDGQVFARTPSGTGYQMSLHGLLGVAAAADEGFEVNLLGLVAGFDLRHPAIKFPGIGRFPGDG